MKEATSEKERVGKLLANVVEKIRRTYVPCGSCGNVYKMEKCLRRFANTVFIVEELLRRVGANVSLDTLIHLGYYQTNKGLERGADYIGVHTDLEISLNGKPVAIITIYDYVSCEDGILVFKVPAYVSKFYDEEVRGGYCDKLPEVSCWVDIAK